ncbi:hypothetical protein HRI_001997600 [Hibiscus trionum]|uniref:Uncharacterized protein n=1 Tax=Hibiscus trionum TaxID=183268 RepID=A0A9W7M0M7_HIBTR|nr:hypothetical protein HRI_001997600 [Hibiscus trionum]
MNSILSDSGRSGPFHSDRGKLGRFNSFENRKPPTIESKFPCSLKELYTGSTRKMKKSRTFVNASGRQVHESKILTIDVKPG